MVIKSEMDCCCTLDVVCEGLELMVSGNTSRLESGDMDSII